MSNWADFRELRCKGFTGKIIAVTGNVNQADVDHFLASGADSVVGKPLTKKKMEQILAGERAPLFTWIGSVRLN